MSCLNFAVRNRSILNQFLHQNVCNKSIASFSTTHHCLADAKKKVDGRATISNEFSIPPRDVSDEGEQFRYLLRNSSFINVSSFQEIFFQIYILQLKLLYRNFADGRS